MLAKLRDFTWRDFTAKMFKISFPPENTFKHNKSFGMCWKWHSRENNCGRKNKLNKCVKSVKSVKSVFQNSLLSERPQGQKCPLKKNL